MLSREMNYEELLGKDCRSLLEHKCEKVPAKTIKVPNSNWVDEVFMDSDRSPKVLRNFQSLINHGRLGNTGYISIFPVDQGVEHSAGASFATNPLFFDSRKIVEFSIEAGCSAVASSLGVLSLTARKYAHKIPHVLKLNHNEFLSYPNKFDQVMYASVQQAADMGCAAVGATVYFGAPESARQLAECARAFEMAHSLGMVTILWCYLRNNAFKVDGVDYHTSTDLSSQANHLGASIGADILKQKLPTNNGGYKATKHGKISEKVYTELTTDHPIDLCRYQVLNGYAGNIGLINSGGESIGAGDLNEAVRTAVINKRAGGMGLILGRKAFQKPWKDGLALTHAVQDVYLDPKVTVA